MVSLWGTKVTISQCNEEGGWAHESSSGGSLFKPEHNPDQPFLFFSSGQNSTWLHKNLVSQETGATWCYKKLSRTSLIDESPPGAHGARWPPWRISRGFDQLLAPPAQRPEERQPGARVTWANRKTSRPFLKTQKEIPMLECIIYLDSPWIIPCVHHGNIESKYNG